MSKQMNRRDFIKFLGKGTMAMGAAVAVGLPEREPQIEIEEIEEVEYEFIVPEESSQDIDSWVEIETFSSDIPFLKSRARFEVAADGTLYIGKLSLA